MRSLVYFFLLVFLSIPGLSQTWQASYDKASKEYEIGNYSESLALAKNAYTLSKSMEAINQAYAIQLITSNLLQLERSDEGLSYVEDEIKLFRQAEGESSKSLAEAMKKQVVFLQNKDRLPEAYAKSKLAKDYFDRSYGKDATPTILFISLMGELALAKGDTIEAISIWKECEGKMAATQDLNEEYSVLLFNMAGILEQTGEFQDALAHILKLTSKLEKSNQTNDELYKNVKESLFRLQSRTKVSAGNDAGSDLSSKLKVAVAFQEKNERARAMGVYDELVKTIESKSIVNKASFSISVNYARLLENTDSLVKAIRVLAYAKKYASTLPPTSFEMQLTNLTEGDIFIKSRKSEKATRQYQEVGRNINNGNYEVLIPYVIYSSTHLINSQNTQLAKAIVVPSIHAADWQKNVSDKMIDLAISYCDLLLTERKPDSVMAFLNKSALSDILPLQLKGIESLQIKGQWSSALNKLNELKTNSSTKWQSEILFQKARTKQQLGDYIGAERDYQSAVQVTTNKSDLELINNSLAILYLQLGDYVKAESIFSRLLASMNPSDFLYIGIQQNLSALYIESNQLNKAQELLQRVVSDLRTHWGENHPDYATAISNLGTLYMKQGDRKNAIKFYNNSLTIAEGNSGKESTDYALKELNLGIALKDDGNSSQATIHLSHALKVFLVKEGNQHPDYALCEYHLAMTYKKSGNIELAIPLMVHASDFYKAQILKLFSAMTEHQQVAYYNKVNPIIQDFQQFAAEQCLKRPEFAGYLFDFRLTTKALLLNFSTRIRNQILSGTDQKLKDQYSHWLRLKEDLGKLYTANWEDKLAYEKAILSLEEQTQLLEKSLSSESALFNENLKGKQVSWREIRAALKDDQAVIEFIRLKSSGKKDSVVYLALLIKSRSENPIPVFFTSAKDMEAREFSFYRNHVIHRVSNTRSFDFFWRPLEPHLKDISTIYVSPDGVFNKISLSTLYDPIGNTYLHSKYKFVTLTNLQELVSYRPAKSSTKQEAVLLGHAKFGNGDVSKLSSNLQRSLNFNQVEELVGTKKEVEEINQLMKNSAWQGSLFMDDEASEKSIKSIKKASLLHIATHGFFVPSSDKDEVVVFSNESEKLSNPMWRSGLILSDINSSTSKSPNSEDGLLTAYEVKNLDFGNSELVVLSACETGSGEIRNGEGVYGLQRAFMIGGAKNVLMSLWKVDDNATQELMVLFYRDYLSGKDSYSALRTAQLELMKKYTDPYFWGSFVLIGNP